jgi:hypothetical protein
VKIVVAGMQAVVWKIVMLRAKALVRISSKQFREVVM